MKSAQSVENKMLEFPEESAGSNWNPALQILISILAIAVLTIALRVPLLGIPLERDEGEYAYIAWRIGFNELPYLDWFDQKPPGIFWIYRLARALPFDGVVSIHVMGLIFSLASAVGLYFIARRLMKNFWATVAALLFTALSVDPFIQGTAANTEIFMLLPIILANLLFMGLVKAETGRKWLMLLIGVANGLAIACKQVALINWVFLLALYPLSIAGDNRLCRQITFMIWSTLGIAVVWGWLALFFYNRQAMGDFIENVFSHNLNYIQTISFSNRLSNLKSTLLSLVRTEGIIWLLAGIGLVKTCISNRNRNTWYLAGWLITGMVGVSASGYYFPHYFQQLLPPLTLLAALGAATLYDMRCWDHVPSAVRRGTCLLILVVLPATTFYPFIFIYSPAEASRKIYPGNPFNEMKEIGQLLEKCTKAEDRIFIFGAEPEILFYAERASATRYIFLFPLYGPYKDVHQKQINAAEEILAAKPAAVVYLPNRLFFASGSSQYLTDWTQRFLAGSYHEIAFLVRDSSGKASLVVGVFGVKPVIPADSDIYGAVYVKNDSALDKKGGARSYK